MTLDEARAEFDKAREEFRRIFGTEARTAGAPGWQACAVSRRVYDEAGLLYSSDTRGESAFYPRIGAETFRTLEIPSTLPTFDELMGRPEYPDDAIVAHYVSLLRTDRPNVLTIHAEIEGMKKRPLFQQLLKEFQDRGVEFARLDALADQLLTHRDVVPVRDLVMAEIDGRSGLVATEAAA
jgi:peptidoglycan/xylan/chitin deacetylase (PgdA/CDA1 family)